MAKNTSKNKDMNSFEALMTEMVQEEQATLRKQKKSLIFHRSASAVIAFFYLLFSLLKGNGHMTFRLLIFLVLPMAAIWFADELGPLTGVRFGRFYGPEVNVPSPGIAVRLIGWVILLMPIWIVLIMHSL